MVHFATLMHPTSGCDDRFELVEVAELDEGTVGGFEELEGQGRSQRSEIRGQRFGGG